PIPCPGYKEIPRELTIDEIKSIIGDFVEGARRARDAGFDMVELHACHGYLISEFFSLRSNRRTDVYGGNAENRARFCTEIIEGIKARLGKDFPVIVRMNGHDYIDGGATLEGMKEIAPFLVYAGADALSISAGVYGSYVATVAPMYEKQGCFAHLAAGIKEVVNVPVISAGRITDPAMAERILETGQADLVAMGRALLADPDLPHKARNGLVEDIAYCTGCNQGCIDRINMSMIFGETRGITCLVNPCVGRERECELRKTDRPKKILVVGAGPGGLETAMIAARRGHRVEVWEKDSRPGGQLSLAGRVPGQEAFADFVAYLERQAGKAGAAISYNRAATADLVSGFSPEAVVVATGAAPIIPSFIKSGNTRLFTAWEILRGKDVKGEQFIVIGGGGVGLETAHYLAVRGKKVKVLEAMSRVGRDLGPIVSSYLRRILLQEGVEVICDVEVRSVENDVIRMTKEGREIVYDQVDGIIVAVGTRPDNSLVESLFGYPNVHVIGDARRPAKALDAINEAFDLGLRL
ncbi:MAG TPA: FAD-dependent oxidoreductase, partial [Syntrophales bacterium]|nr:FAD-dependent oxidoreductase [Syntrophales bacterium]